MIQGNVFGYEFYFFDHKSEVFYVKADLKTGM